MKLVKYISIFYALCFLQGAMAKPLEKVIPKWQKIMGMIQEEERTIRGLGKLGPRLQYRIVELHSEKIKLLKEKENLKFLSSSFKLRKRQPVSSYKIVKIKFRS